MTDQSSSDHDLLIEISTNIKTIYDNQTRFIERMEAFDRRLINLEIKDRGDSERVIAISKDVQMSLENHTRIAKLETASDLLKTDLTDLKKKSNLIDAINAALAAIAGAIAYFLGHR